MTNLFKVTAVFTALFSVLSCNEIEQPQIQNAKSEKSMVSTRSFNQKIPKMAVYVETNDVNPLNAGDYTMSNGTSFIDIVELFAANIHKDVNGAPTLYLNAVSYTHLEPTRPY